MLRRLPCRAFHLDCWPHQSATLGCSPSSRSLSCNCRPAPLVFLVICAIPGLLSLSSNRLPPPAARHPSRLGSISRTRGASQPARPEPGRRDGLAPFRRRGLRPGPPPFPPRLPCLIHSVASRRPPASVSPSTPLPSIAIAVYSASPSVLLSLAFPARSFDLYRRRLFSCPCFCLKPN
jgi:hypothetical protein